jgi:hypothetical protein
MHGTHTTDELDTVSGYKTALSILCQDRIRTCPDWHIGGGGPCWVFADEVVVR